MQLHHEQNVDYQVEESVGKKLRKNPVGIKLFCDRENNNCKVFCISCHKPMEEVGKRMRVENYFLSCMRCHERS